MADKPILYSTDMVLACLDLRKTHTRRTAGLEVVNKNPDGWNLVYEELGTFYFEPKDKHCIAVMCKPRFQVGDSFWVKETWAILDGNRHFEGTANRALELGLNTIHYKAGALLPNFGKWRSSLFMPRWASRIRRQITGVVCERVQDITPEDCIAEGIELQDDKYIFQGYQFFKAISAYQALWDSINGTKYPWSLNPWVWVYKFSKDNVTI